jgi:aerotaxis receptor
MRTNLPVTQREHPLPEGVTLMSTTDTTSRIRYANAPFVQVSGFSRDELIGQPHNIVRHPDMPAEAFADMWATLKQGASWTALVKNRRKDDDHYWVRANATPIVRNGSVQGYMSVRTRPTSEEVRAAEALYARMREGRAQGLRLHRGILVRTGALAWMSWHKTMSVAGRIRLACALSTLPPLALALATAQGLGKVALDVGIAMVAALLANTLLQRQIARPIRTITEQTQSVAAGQLACAVQLDRCDDIGMLNRAVTQAGLNLQALLDDVGAQTGGLATATGQIAAGNQDLSSRTEEAASSLQETAASMEQMTSTVKQSAENANTAAQLARDACTAANSGGQVVTDVAGTMQRISDSSRKIADIIGVIDGIAFQTNILALNAAVEAARAGEQGRGFAVVASEVRALAQRAAGSAREIKTLIGGSVENVEAGNRLAGEAAQSMQQIVDQVRKVGDLIAEMSSAAREQSQGIGQVNVAVTQLDEMTQRNAALVEQGAAAAASIGQQAEALSEAVAAFRG